MRRAMVGCMIVGLVALGLVGTASAFTQLSNIRVYPTSGTKPIKGGQNAILDSYLASRDPDSLRGPMKKTNPAGSLDMKFPTGGTVNKAAVGAANVCKLSEYATVTALASSCAKAVMGTGWALLNDGNLNPFPQMQIDGAPPACKAGDATQYSRTWEANPGAGPDCVPIGEVYVKVTGYQGGVLRSQYWCYGMDAINNVAATKNPNGTPKDCYFKAPNGKYFNFSGGYCKTPGTNPATNQPYSLDVINNRGPAYGCRSKADIHWFRPGGYVEADNGCNVVFSNVNGLSPLAFGGAANSCQNILSVVVPALNGSGSGLGELTGGFVMSDFYLRTNVKTYLKAGPCPRGNRFSVDTTFRWSKLLGESAIPPSNPTQMTVAYPQDCTR